MAASFGLSGGASRNRSISSAKNRSWLRWRKRLIEQHFKKLPLAGNVVCCKKALRPKLRAKRKCPACARNVENDPKRTFSTVGFRIAKGSLDHLVGDRENVLRHLDTECARRLKVDDELEFGRLQHRQVGGLGALEDVARIDAD